MNWYYEDWLYSIILRSFKQFTSQDFSQNKLTLNVSDAAIETGNFGAKKSAIFRANFGAKSWKYGAFLSKWWLVSARRFEIVLFLHLGEFVCLLGCVQLLEGLVGLVVQDNQVPDGVNESINQFWIYKFSI